MTHFYNGSTHRSYWFKPDNNPLSHLCYVAVSVWYAPGNAIIAKIPTHYLPRRYVTWLPKLQENSKYWFKNSCSKPLHVHKQLLIASCFWNCFTMFNCFTDGNICLGFIGRQSSILISWHSTVPCLMFMFLQCHFKKPQTQLLTVGRKKMHIIEPHRTAFREIHRPLKQWLISVQMCCERSSFLTLTQRQK